MYDTLIAQIKATLESIGAIKVVYAHPVTDVANYPAVIFFPDAFQNTFQSTADNSKVYRFHMYVVVGTNQKDNTSIFETVLPKAVDAVLAAFDAGWDGGMVGGHRVWLLVNSGLWSMSVTQSGIEAQAELTLEIRTTTTN